MEGLILLAGAYTAISPWVVHFTDERDLTVSDLIVGITVGLMGLLLTLVPERMFRLTRVVAPLGVWLLISPLGGHRSPPGVVTDLPLGWSLTSLWVVTAAHGPRSPIIWNSCWPGAVTAVLGLAAMGLTIGVTRRPALRHRPA